MYVLIASYGCPFGQCVIRAATSAGLMPRRKFSIGGDALIASAAPSERGGITGWAMAEFMGKNGTPENGCSQPKNGCDCDEYHLTRRKGKGMLEGRRT